MKLTKKYLKALVEQELQNVSYEMAPGTGGEGVSGIVDPQMSMEPTAGDDEDEEDGEEAIYSASERDIAAAPHTPPTKIYSMGAGHPYMGSVKESNIAKLKRLIKKSVYETLSEGDITREKRYQWDDGPGARAWTGGPESADEPEAPPEPEGAPSELISQAQELHATLMQTAAMPGSMVGQLRRDLRELGLLLDELAEHIGPGDGDTEVDARGHGEDDDPGLQARQSAMKAHDIRASKTRSW
jgi:hypothetical protein